VSQVLYPVLRFDPDRDQLVVWVRWVSMESPPSPESPPRQGLRGELKLDGNPVFGPTILWRKDLATPVYVTANTLRTRAVVKAAARKGVLDIQLTIHGSIANAPYLALYHVRDYPGAAIDTQPIQGTPLLQVQPSTPGDQWHVAGQASLRVRVELEGESRSLPVFQ
jgi:hypothetical protein